MHQRTGPDIAHTAAYIVQAPALSDTRPTADLQTRTCRQTQTQTQTHTHTHTSRHTSAVQQPAAASQPPHVVRRSAVRPGTEKKTVVQSGDLGPVCLCLSLSLARSVRPLTNVSGAMCCHWRSRPPAAHDSCNAPPRGLSRQVSGQDIHSARHAPKPSQLGSASRAAAPAWVLVCVSRICVQQTAAISSFFWSAASLLLLACHPAKSCPAPPSAGRAGQANPLRVTPIAWAAQAFLVL